MPDDNLDAFSVFGIQKPRTSAEEIFHRELERRSFDVIRVKNPDNKDFFVDWDHRYHRVPANGTADLPRYIAVHYIRNKSVDIVNKLAQKMHDEFITDRRKKGLPEYQDKNIENNETYMTQQYPKTNDRELMTKIYSELWLGLVYEFGKDNPLPQQKATEYENDITPLEEKILRELGNRKVDLGEQKPVKEPVKSVFSEPVNQSKEEILKEVIQNEPEVVA